MGFLISIGRALAPIALEHGGTMVRDWWKGRVKHTEQFQQLAKDLDQLKEHAARVDSDLDALNNAFTAREERLRKWILTLLIWNLALTSGLLLTFFALRH